MMRILRKINIKILLEVLAVVVLLCLFGFYYRQVHIKGNGASPVITVLSDSDVFSVASGDEALLEGVTAVDKESGDVTHTLFVESISQMVDGVREVTYVAYDGDKNVSKLTREISYSDYVPPTITIKRELIFDNGSADEILSCLSATDVIDGDITDKIKIEQNRVTAGRSGTYEVTVNVTNSCGDMTILNTFVTIR